jgi:AcrR family transcriptional regulator
MTKLVDRPNPDGTRGERRRDALERAGLALLAEHGWAGVTARAVAEHAGTNPGLLHYHYGGLPGFRYAVASRAADAVVEPFLQAVEAGSMARTVPELLGSTTAVDPAAARLTAALLAGALLQDDVGRAVRDRYRSARSRVADLVRREHPDWSDEQVVAVAVLVVGALDGLLLQAAVDPELDLRPAGELLVHAVEVRP